MLTGKDSFNYSRKPEIMADAAYHILTQDPTTTTGNFFIDDEVLASAGVTNFDQYCCNPEFKDKLMPDFYVTCTPLPLKQDTKPIGKIAQLFKAIESTLSKELVEKTQAVFQFNVTGKEAGQWFVLITGGYFL